MSKRDLQYLNDILVRCQEIVEFTKGMSATSFSESRLPLLATERHIITIGEAAKNLSTEVREANPDIEWKKMGRTRDLIIHHYFGTDYDIVWRIVEIEIPKLLQRIPQIIATIQ